MHNPKISIIIPAHNEAESIGTLVREIRSLHPEAEVIVVNDGSTDETAKVAHEAGAHRLQPPLQHRQRCGDQERHSCGLRGHPGFHGRRWAARPCRKQERLLELLPEYDMVVGARSVAGRLRSGAPSATKSTTGSAPMWPSFPIQDLTSGFRAVKAESAPRLPVSAAQHLLVPTTITLGVLRSGPAAR